MSDEVIVKTKHKTGPKKRTRSEKKNNFDKQMRKFDKEARTNTVPDTDKTEPEDLVTKIFKREIERLNTKSIEAELNIDDLKRLDILTRSLKQYTPQEIERDNNPLDQLDVNQLLTIVGSE